MAGLKGKLVANPYTLVAFVSPSRTGVKAMVGIPTSDNKHWIKCLAEYYRERFNTLVDEQCCDTSRLCFVSHDMDAYYNPDARVFDIAKCKKNCDSEEKSKTESGNTFELFQKAVARTDKKGTYAQGNRNTYIFNLACQCHNLGIAQSETERLITDNFDLPQKEVESAVKSACSYPTNQRVTMGKTKTNISRETDRVVLDENTILNVSVTDSDDLDGDFDRYGFFISEGCYHTLENRRNQRVKVKLSNFVMQVLYKMDDGTCNSKRLIKIQRGTGEIYIAEVSNSDTSIEKFEVILKSYSCTFFGSSYHFKRMG